MGTATTERKSAASTSKKPAGVFDPEGFGGELSRTAQTRRAGKTITCAFCGGTGRDPYRILSKVSDCPVCKGHKSVQVETPVVACLYCKGTGRQRHTRLTCSACRGAGVITLPGSPGRRRGKPGPTAACVQCDGSGREPEADLPCSRCKGAGLVATRGRRGDHCFAE